MLTLHNLAFQGQFKAELYSRLGLPAQAFDMRGLEYHGDIGFLKAGIHFADAITTVSPTYAREIRTLAGGMGMDAMLRWRGDAVKRDRQWHRHAGVEPRHRPAAGQPLRRHAAAGARAQPPRGGAPLRPAGSPPRRWSA